MAVAQHPSGYLERPKPSGLADVIEIILDKGIVIDAYVRVSLIGIELITIDARIVIASVDTYLRFAEAVSRLDITDDGSQGLPELMENMTRAARRPRPRARSRAPRRSSASAAATTTTTRRAAAAARRRTSRSRSRSAATTMSEVHVHGVTSAGERAS